MDPQSNSELTHEAIRDMAAEEALAILANYGEAFIGSLRAVHSPPVGQKSLRLYRLAETAALVGRSESWLRAQENDAKFPKLANRTDSGRRMYSLAEINAIREYAGTSPTPPTLNEPYILGMVNFKGGSSKTTVTYLASHFLATQGFRVLVVDLDPQGSLTSSFELFTASGERVSALDWENTIGPVLAGEAKDAEGLILKTHWPTIDVIPASVDVYEADLIMAVETVRNGNQKAFPFWRRLGDTLRKIKGYDFILMDSAPALNLAAVNAVAAADGLIIPVPPRNLDLEAAVKFATVVAGWTQQLPGFHLRKRWLRLLLTQLQRGSTSDQTHALLARRYFGALVLDAAFPMSEAVRRGSAGAPSCYEGSTTDRNQAEANRRVRESLDEVFAEILSIIFKHQEGKAND